MKIQIKSFQYTAQYFILMVFLLYESLVLMCFKRQNDLAKFTIISNLIKFLLVIIFTASILEKNNIVNYMLLSFELISTILHGLFYTSHDILEIHGPLVLNLMITKLLVKSMENYKLKVICQVLLNCTWFVFLKEVKFTSVFSVFLIVIQSWQDIYHLKNTDNFIKQAKDNKFEQSVEQIVNLNNFILDEKLPNKYARKQYDSQKITYEYPHLKEHAPFCVVKILFTQENNQVFISKLVLFYEYLDMVCRTLNINKLCGNIDQYAVTTGCQSIFRDINIVSVDQQTKSILMFATMCQIMSNQLELECMIYSTKTTIHVGYSGNPINQLNVSYFTSDDSYIRQLWATLIPGQIYMDSCKFSQPMKLKLISTNFSSQNDLSLINERDIDDLFCFYKNEYTNHLSTVKYTPLMLHQLTIVFQKQMHYSGSSMQISSNKSIDYLKIINMYSTSSSASNSSIKGPSLANMKAPFQSLGNLIEELDIVQLDTQIEQSLDQSIDGRKRLVNYTNGTSLNQFQQIHELEFDLSNSSIKSSLTLEQMKMELDDISVSEMMIQEASDQKVTDNQEEQPTQKTIQLQIQTIQHIGQTNIFQKFNKYVKDQVFLKYTTLHFKVDLLPAPLYSTIIFMIITQLTFYFFENIDQHTQKRFIIQICGQILNFKSLLFTQYIMLVLIQVIRVVFSKYVIKDLRSYQLDTFQRHFKQYQSKLSRQNVIVIDTVIQITQLTLSHIILLTTTTVLLKNKYQDNNKTIILMQQTFIQLIHMVSQDQIMHSQYITLLINHFNQFFYGSIIIIWITSFNFIHGNYFAPIVLMYLVFGYIQKFVNTKMIISECITRYQIEKEYYNANKQFMVLFDNLTLMSSRKFIKPLMQESNNKIQTQSLEFRFLNDILINNEEKLKKLAKSLNSLKQKQIKHVLSKQQEENLNQFEQLYFQQQMVYYVYDSSFQTITANKMCCYNRYFILHCKIESVQLLQNQLQQQFFLFLDNYYKQVVKQFVNEKITLVNTRLESFQLVFAVNKDNTASAYHTLLNVINTAKILFIKTQRYDQSIKIQYSMLYDNMHQVMLGTLFYTNQYFLNKQTFDYDKQLQHSNQGKIVVSEQVFTKIDNIVQKYIFQKQSIFIKKTKKCKRNKKLTQFEKLGNNCYEINVTEQEDW